MRLFSIVKPYFAPSMVIILALVIGLAAFSLGTDRERTGSEEPLPEESDQEEAHSNAQMFPLPVYGYVKDSLGNPVQGALVTVMTFSGEVLKANLTYFTDAAGFFTVSFDGNYWDIGWTVAANATYGVYWVNESVLIDIDTIEVFFELQFSVLIPEFSNLLFVVGATALVFVFASWRGRRQL